MGRSPQPFVGALAAFIAASALLSGCASDADPDDDIVPQTVDLELAAQIAAQYGYDVATTTETPAFSLVPQYQDPRDLYARILLAQQCMAGLVTYVVNPPPAPNDADVFDPRSGDRRFNVLIAQTWGYQVPPPDLSQQATEALGADVATIDAKREECGARANDRLGSSPDAFLGSVVSAGWDALAVDTGVSDASAAWKDCMAPVGVIDLPESPSEMPSASVAPMADENPGQTATPEERNIAVADAQCRDQVGYNTAVLTARANGELSAIGRDVQTFEAVRAEFEQYGRGVEEVIQQLG